MFKSYVTLSIVTAPTTTTTNVRLTNLTLNKRNNQRQSNLKSNLSINILQDWVTPSSLLLYSEHIVMTVKRLQII